MKEYIAIAATGTMQVDDLWTYTGDTPEEAFDKMMAEIVQFGVDEYTFFVGKPGERIRDIRPMCINQDELDEYMKKRDKKRQIEMAEIQGIISKEEAASKIKALEVSEDWPVPKFKYGEWDD